MGFIDTIKYRGAKKYYIVINDESNKNFPRTIRTIGYKLKQDPSMKNYDVLLPEFKTHLILPKDACGRYDTHTGLECFEYYTKDRIQFKLCDIKISEDLKNIDPANSELLNIFDQTEKEVEDFFRNKSEQLNATIRLFFLILGFITLVLVAYVGWQKGLDTLGGMAAQAAKMTVNCIISNATVPLA